MWKIILPVVVVLLLIIGVFVALKGPSESMTLPLGGTAQTPASAPASRPSPGRVEPGNDAMERRLMAATAQLTQALNFMQRAAANGHGGFVEKSVEDLNRALAHMADVTAYVHGHPENTTPGPPALVAAAREEITTFGPGDETGSPNLRQALLALLGALDQLQGVPEANGLRDRAVGDVAQASSDIIGGINFAQQNGGGRGRGRGRAGAMPGDPGPRGRGAP